MPTSIQAIRRLMMCQRITHRERDLFMLVIKNPPSLKDSLKSTI